MLVKPASPSHLEWGHCHKAIYRDERTRLETHLRHHQQGSHDIKGLVAQHNLLQVFNSSRENCVLSQSHLFLLNMIIIYRNKHHIDSFVQNCSDSIANAFSGVTLVMD